MPNDSLLGEAPRRLSIRQYSTRLRTITVKDTPDGCFFIKVLTKNNKFFKVTKFYLKLTKNYTCFFKNDKKLEQFSTCRMSCMNYLSVLCEKDECLTCVVICMNVLLVI